MTPFDLKSFKQMQTDEITYVNAWKTLMLNPGIDLVSYRQQIHMQLRNLSLDPKGFFYIEYVIPRDCDILTDFNIKHIESKFSDIPSDLVTDNIKTELIVNGKSINLTKDVILLPVSARCTALTIRFTFRHNPVNIEFSFKAFVCENVLRKTLLDDPVSSSGLTYKDGYVTICE